MPRNDSSPTSQLNIRRTVDGKSQSEAAALAELRRKKMERTSREKLHSDPFLWGIYLMILVFSVVELYSASSSDIKNGRVFDPIIQHGIFLLVGLVIIFIMSNIHYKYYRKTAVWMAVISVVLIVWSMVAGVNINNAQRAIRLAGFTVQPAEIAKLALVVILAKVISKFQMPKGVTNKGLIVALLIIALFTMLLFRNGLTNTILVAGTGLSMLIIGGLQMKKVVLVGIIVIVLGGGVLAAKLTGGDTEQPKGTATEQTANNMVANEEVEKEVDRSVTRKLRIIKYLEGVTPNDKITDDNRQVMMSRFALAHGEIWGNGPGNSRENARLPLAYSDYIFSIIVEDTGFLGGCFLMLMYLSLIGAAGRIAVKCRKAFPALLIMGCAVMIVMQALMHMAIVVGLAPVSGQPLPFISKGGTSVIVMSAALGMMLSVSKFAVRTGNNGESTKLREAVADKAEADNPTMLVTKNAEVNNKDNNDPLTY